jgi:hypothetical protein
VPPLTYFPLTLRDAAKIGSAFAPPGGPAVFPFSWWMPLALRPGFSSASGPSSMIYPQDKSVLDAAIPALIEQKRCHKNFVLRKASGYWEKGFLITLKN